MRPRTPLPVETIALRQMLVAVGIALPLGFVATVAALLWLRHWAEPGPFWSWGLAGWLLHCLELGVPGALGLGAAVFAVLSRIQCRLGYHRCPFCNRAKKRF